MLSMTLRMSRRTEHRCCDLCSFGRTMRSGPLEEAGRGRGRSMSQPRRHRTKGVVGFGSETLPARHGRDGRDDLRAGLFVGRDDQRAVGRADHRADNRRLAGRRGVSDGCGRPGQADPVAQLRRRSERQGDQGADRRLHGQEPERHVRAGRPAGRQLLRAAQDGGDLEDRAGPDDDVDRPVRPSEPGIPRAPQPVHPDGHAEQVRWDQLVLEGSQGRDRRHLRSARSAVLQRLLQQGALHQGRCHVVPDDLGRALRRLRQAEGDRRHADDVWHGLAGAQRRASTRITT